MALPRKLKNMNLFADGDNWQGLIEEFTTAKLTKKLKTTGAAAWLALLVSTWVMKTTRSMSNSPWAALK